MVRSIWRGALVVMLAWVGLAWSQPARNPSAGGTSSATMTVHENGKDVPCRVVTSWQQPNGSKAYQLQIIATGEMLTLVEDGPATTYQGKSGKMRALSMRIFHWGNRHTSPPGVPAPPEHVISDQETGKPIILSESNVHLISLTPDPVLPPGCKMCSPPTAVPGGNVACNACPTGLCSNSSCSGMVQNQGTGSFPYSQMPSGNKLGSGSASKEIVSSQSNNQGPATKPETIVGTVPGSKTGTPTTRPGTSFVAQGPSIQGSQAVTQTPSTYPGPGTKPGTSFVAQGPATQGSQIVTQMPSTYPGPGTRSGTSLVQGSQIVTQMPSTYPGSGTKPGTSFVAQGPVMQGNQVVTQTPSNYPGPGTKVVPGTLPNIPSTQQPKTGAYPNVPKETVVTLPPSASGQVSAQTQAGSLAGQAGSLPGQTKSTGQIVSAGSQTNQTAAKPHTLSEKIKHIFHPGEPVDTAQNAATGNGGGKQKPAAARTIKSAGTVVNQGGTTATTVDSGTGKTSLTNTQPLNIPGRNVAAAPTTLPKVAPGTTGPTAGVSQSKAGSSTLVSADPQSRAGTVPVTDAKTQEKKSTWEKIWGKPFFAKTRQPGQTTVDPTPTGKGPLVPGAKTQATGTVIAQAFPAPTTKNVPAPGSGATLVDVTPSTLPPAPPATPSNLVPAGPAKVPQAVAQGKAVMPPASSYAEKDPLLNPDQIKSSRVEAKAGNQPAPPVAKAQPKTVPQHGMNAAAGGMQNQLPPLPMGAGSVTAATNGLPIPYAYMPVPLVTVPNPLRNPGPPPPNVPAAPQPTSYVNAFTPRAAPKPENQQNPAPPNMAMGPYGPGPYGAGPYSAGPYGPDPRMMGYPPQVVAQGMPYPGMSPYMMPYGQMAYGPGAMPQVPPMNPMGMQRPILQVNYPSNYQGPMAPNPMIGSNMPPMPYQQPMMPQVPMLQYGNPAMDRPGMAPPGQTAGSLNHMLCTLRDSISPAEREMVALNLANVDWRSHPEIVQVLVTSARQDPAATVRASCVRSLAVQNMNSEPVLATFHALKNDPDPRVRQEADQALVRLSGSAPINMPALQPAGHQP